MHDKGLEARKEEFINADFHSGVGDDMEMITMEGMSTLHAELIIGQPLNQNTLYR
jgi:hypothetical protein